MKTTREYPFPLPILENKDEFISAVEDVAAAINERDGKITDYYENKLPRGGKIGVIEVEEEA